MIKKTEIRYNIDVYLFKYELESRGITIESLNDSYSPNYIGVSPTTIHRGLKNGWFTRRTIDKLSEIVDTDMFVIETDYDKIEQLENENQQLNRTVQHIRNLLDELKYR